VQSPAAARAAAGQSTYGYIDMPDAHQARFHLALMHRGALLELRAKQDRGMAQLFGADVDELAAHAVKASHKTDVYVGVLPRLRQAGGKDALPPEGHVVWCEADTEAAMLRVIDFEPAAHLLVQSSPGKVHAYWFLRGGLELRWLEVANRRLAWHLGGDLRATDAARILRVAGTRNWKRGAPTRVAITRASYHGNVDIGALVRDLPDPKPPKPIRVASPRRPLGADVEALRDIPARQYIPALSGRDLYHNFAQCPFHKGGQERTPSLSVGGPNETLWKCFGCQEGGDVFDFAARLWGLDVRNDFPTIKLKLKETLR
jgi:hypothetical protein